MSAWLRTQNAHEKMHEGGPEAIIGTLIVMWKTQKGNEEALQSDTLTQPVRHIDWNINPARHTDEYARSTTKVPHQIHRNRPSQRSRCCSTEATTHFQSDPLPAAGWNEPDKVHPWIKTVTTTRMTKLLSRSALCWNTTQPSVDR